MEISSTTPSQGFSEYILRSYQYVFVAVVIGALATTLPLKEYYTRLLAIPRLALIPFGFYFPDLPGVFEHNPKPHFVNGNLWTLGFESTMYVVIVLLLKTQSLLKVNILLPCTLLYGAYLFLSIGFIPPQYMGARSPALLVFFAWQP
jgi:hypothetical protein